jgi:polyisoprenoid-binding protein YceI
MKRVSILAAVAAFAIINGLAQTAGAQAARGRGAAPAGPPTAIKLEVMEGSKAQYRVREQLAGVSFPNDAVGSTTGVTGTLVILADGTVDGKQSRIIVDLKTLRSDQDMRDGFIRGDRGLNTEKFPTAEFVPKRVVGLPWPLPSGQGAQSGFQLVGDMTIYGNTSEVIWNIVATFNPQQVAGRATTEFPFTKFSIPKPQLARLLSVDDTIHLELEIRMRRQPM